MLLSRSKAALISSSAIASSAATLNGEKEVLFFFTGDVL